MMRTNTRRSRRGAAAAEFALVFPVLVAFLAGMVDASWYLTHYHQITRIAQDSVAVASHTYENPQLHAPGSRALIAAQEHALRSFELQELPCDPAICTISVSRSEGALPVMTVEIRYTVEPIMGLILDAVNVSHSASAAYSYP